MTKNVIVLPGDGVGTEVTDAAVRVMEAVGELYDVSFNLERYHVGGASLDEYDTPIKDEVIEACQESDAVLLGAVGGPKWDGNTGDKRPEAALLALRKELELFTNLRPVKVYDALVESSSLKPEIVQGVDILVVRELTGGIYFGRPRFTEDLPDDRRAVDTLEYKTSEITRIAKVAFEAAGSRRGRVTSVDKANILETSRLWRDTVGTLATKYTEIDFEHMLVDNCAMQLVRYPKQFDVILTTNMFGDILSDEASMLTGSIGMLPSASLGNGTAMYEPVHGSAPDIAGKGVANPLATIASVAMMFRFSFDLEEAAQQIEQSIENVLNNGVRTGDLTDTDAAVGTDEMTEAILNEFQQHTSVAT
ncbi:MAG: 3-isopropylmalate dehydrogenase [Candidatus Marinimicrobia bacterium]|nr:3-isopropylmalate dehydrogenase [Candidatus Neomarinimicrobiota bacterium]MCF7828670.1 3-isopropylmalate dehydrogenase [Candidatus Neomarinimicrobiota bacterium]MCF7880411.1 3-isopropylmalate dehydrogenase [Candidatus Neomarinimicrobiota bacterium]